MDLERGLEEKKEEPLVWRSCCLAADPKAVIFFSQLSIALITVFFCIFQLVTLKECEAQSLYSSILMLVLGVYIPQPSMK